MLVQDIMVSDLVTISPSATITEAASTMLYRGTTSLFVAEGDRLLGVITDQDILYSVVAQGLSPMHIVVWEFMNYNPPVAYPGMDIISLISIMELHRLTKLPVIDDAKLIGTITLADIAAKLDLI